MKAAVNGIPFVMGNLVHIIQIDIEHFAAALFGLRNAELNDEYEIQRAAAN